jgi:hypothetical protein
MARQIELWINTFGQRKVSRYGLPPRRHRIAPEVHKREPASLHDAIRGGAIAAYLAHADGSEKDLAVALATMQRCSAELASRLLEDYTITIATDPRTIDQVKAGETADPAASFAVDR